MKTETKIYNLVLNITLMYLIYKTAISESQGDAILYSIIAIINLIFLYKINKKYVSN